jgi:carbon storage regulator
MLVLTRKAGEKILIDGGIEVCIIDVRRDGVRIGINAPSSTRIQREEVVRALEAENVAATAGGSISEHELLASLPEERQAKAR